jgi:hypothetical protein
MKMSLPVFARYQYQQIEATPIYTSCIFQIIRIGIRTLKILDIGIFFNCCYLPLSVIGLKNVRNIWNNIFLSRE